MSGTINLDVLAKDEVRTAILLTEIGGWLHMLGKLDNRFAPSQAQSSTSRYDDLDLSQLWQPLHSRFCSLLTDTRIQAMLALTTPSQQSTAPSHLDSFIRNHRTRSVIEASLRILVDAHGMASGTEKGTLPNNEGKQTATNTHTANAFGYENKSDNLISRNLDALRSPTITAVENALDQIFGSSLSVSDWKSLYFPLKAQLSDCLSQSVGDTRRPANEVTLWDQTVTAAALLKTGLVQNVLTGSWRDPLVNNFADKYRWRFLRIYYDGLTFIANAHHPTDLRGRWKALQDAQETIRRLLEVTYPLAAVAYHDEANLVFVVPDLPDLLTATLNHQGATITLKDWIRNAFAAELQGELEPRVWLSERSRGAINLGQALREELSSPQPNPNEMSRWWSSAVDEICTVCRVRPQGYGSGNAQKARSRNVCCICLERREKRSKDWADHLSEATIWIDEAADKNGRVALIAGKFDLTGWLDGKYLGSFAGRKLPSDAGFSTADYSTIISALASRELSQANLNGTTSLRAMQQNTNIPNNLSPANIYEVLVTERDLDGVAPSPASADYDRAARHLFRGFFGKTTSFARLRRIWETTGEFWENVKKALGDCTGKQKYRLILQGQFNNSIGPSHVYDARLGKVETSFVYDGTRLISADNLRYLAKQLTLDLPDKAEDKAIAEAVKRKLETFDKLELFEKPSRQGQSVKVAVLRDFNVVIEEHNYSPVIPLLAEPQIFIALVPADKAMTIITHLRDEYERQMSKVRNRLPLHLNLLTFNRRVPLYVAMDAVRRMLDRKTDSAAQWNVAEATKFDDSNGKLGRHAMRLKLSPVPGNQWARQQITASVSYNLGDDNEDFYYPYFFVTQANEDNASSGKPLSGRPHHWQAIHPKHNPTAFTDLVHVSELCKDDIVLYSPSTFDFKHLDVAGRRFELNYDEAGVRVKPANRLHPATRPFLLEEIADLETVWKALKKLPSGQRDFLARLIETKRTEWKVTTADDAVLRRFACDALRQAGNQWWKNLGDEQRRLLEAWAANGKLADAVELYEKMMKLEIE